MLHDKLDQIDEATLAALCKSQCPESQTLDFKRDLPDFGPKGKNEFLKDVCAFANAEGGDIIFGIADKSGCADSINPISSENEDAARRRLLQILDAGVEPRISGCRAVGIAVSGGYVLVFRVPISFDGPHRFKVEKQDNQHRFVMRNGTHTIDLSYDQLRSAFDRTATLLDRIRRFREERLALISDGKTWRPFPPGSPLLIVHVIPTVSMTGRFSIDINHLYDNFTNFMPNLWSGQGGRTLNLDGLVVHPPMQNDAPVLNGFNQIFRSGAMEAIQSLYLSGDGKIRANVAAHFIRDLVSRFIPGLEQLEIQGPSVVCCTCTHVDGRAFDVNSIFPHNRNAMSDRQDLFLPEIWIESAAAVSDIDTVVRPMLDILWQAFTFKKCTLYDANGKWNAR